MSSEKVAVAPAPGLFNQLFQLGVLRTLLLLGSFITAASAPFAVSITEGFWDIIRGGVMPALAPLFFMVLLLDALMARVWMGEYDGAERLRLKRGMQADLAMVLLLVLAWGPFFYGIFTF